MKKPLYYLDEYEKNRILEMHKTSTKKQYITENKKVLNEAFWLWALGITGVAAGAGYVWKNWGTIMGNVTEEKFLKLNTACDKPEVSSQKTYNTSQQHVSFAKDFRKAFDWGETYSFGIDVGTDNELVTSTLSSIKSMADYCKERKEFKKLYGKDLGSEMNDEIDKNFDKIVMDALSGAIKKSVEDGMEIEGYSEDKVDNRIKPDDGNKPDDEFKQSGGGQQSDSEDPGINWTTCMSEYKLGCKDLEYSNEVKKIQRCLGLEPSGKFGKKTESELQSQFGKKTINDDEIPLLCGDF